MSQRYDQPPTTSVRGSSDLACPLSPPQPASGDSVCDSATGCYSATEDSPWQDDSECGLSVAEELVGVGRANRVSRQGSAPGLAVMEGGSATAAVESPSDREVTRGRLDFYSGARVGLDRPSRVRGWLASLRLDAYAWRAIVLMLSFLAFGLIVSSFVLSL